MTATPLRRIVFVTSGLARGGAEAQLVYLSRELVRRGHAVGIYTLNRELDRLPELDGSGVQVRIDQKRVKLDFALLFRLVRFVRAFRAELVQGFMYDGNLYGCLAACWAGTNAVVSERSDNYRLNTLQCVSKPIIRHLARGVFANSHSGGRFAQQLYGFSAARIHTVWNGIDLDMIDERLRNCHANFKMLFFGTLNVRVAVLVGNIRPAKDFQLALDAANDLCQRAPDWRVLFLGDDIRATGKYKQEMIDYHQSLDSRDCILFAGKREDAIEIVSRCDVLFSTSQNEGFPNVVLEAMSAGVPVVSTEYSDIRQILPLAWQVIDTRDPKLMSEAIERAHRERGLLSPLQREWVEHNASIQISVDRYEAACNCVLPICAESVNAI